MIKIFESFNNIKSFCTKNGIDNYTINSDGTVDVNSDVFLIDLGINRLPFKFNNIRGSFTVINSKLTTLENSPNYVGGDFSCDRNKLISLEYSPKTVVGDFFCSNNDITSLEHSPKLENRSFICAFNNLTNLRYAPTNCNFYDFDNNDLDDIFKNALNKKNIHKVIDNQEDYKIWKDDGTLNVKRFELLLSDIENDII